MCTVNSLRWIISDWLGRCRRMATSASRMARSSSASLSFISSWMVGIEQQELGDARGEPGRAEADGGGDEERARSGSSWLSVICVSTCCSSQYMRWAVRKSCSPTSVRTRPRAWRMKSFSPRSSSSAEICRRHGRLAHAELFGGVGKAPGLSSGVEDAQLVPIEHLLGRLGQLVGGEEFFGLERGHAAHAGGGHRLAEDVVGDVAGGDRRPGCWSRSMPGLVWR